MKSLKELSEKELDDLCMQVYEFRMAHTNATYTGCMERKEFVSKLKAEYAELKELYLIDEVEDYIFDLSMLKK